MRKPRAVAALAVLLGLLLNVAGPSHAQPNRDSRAALGNGEIARNAGLRATTRTLDEDGADCEHMAVALPPQPRIATDLLSIRPAAPLGSAAASAQFFAPSPPYRARAPPAA